MLRIPDDCLQQRTFEAPMLFSTSTRARVLRRIQCQRKIKKTRKAGPAPRTAVNQVVRNPPVAVRVRAVARKEVAAVAQAAAIARTKLGRV